MHVASADARFDNAVTAPKRLLVRSQGEQQVVTPQPLAGRSCEPANLPQVSDP